MAMVINQGNNFSQLTASKISYSLNEYILANSTEITKFDNIIIDLDSFKKILNLIYIKILTIISTIISLLICLKVGAYQV